MFVSFNDLLKVIADSGAAKPPDSVSNALCIEFVPRDQQPARRQDCFRRVDGGAVFINYNSDGMVLSLEFTRPAEYE